LKFITDSAQHLSLQVWLSGCIGRFSGNLLQSLY